MACKCGLPPWQYGQSQCCSERLLRAMPLSAALYLLEHQTYDVSEAFRNEYRAKWRSNRGSNASKPNPV